MPREGFGVSPDSLDAVCVDEAHRAIYELPAVADGHMTVEIIVAAPLISEDETLRSCGAQDSRAERFLSTVGDALQKTLLGVSGHSSEDPLLAEHAFVPFRDAGNG